MPEHERKCAFLVVHHRKNSNVLPWARNRQWNGINHSVEEGCFNADTKEFTQRAKPWWVNAEEPLSVYCIFEMNPSLPSLRKTRIDVSEGFHPLAS
jgi:hypothetical protein